MMSRHDGTYGKWIGLIKIIIKILCVLFMLFLIVLYGTEKNNARKVLHDAKLIRLVTQNTYYDYYASNKPFFKDNETGLRPGGEKEILELAQCKGEIRHVEFNEDSFRVSRLIYTEKGYVVVFTDTGDNPQWTVYKLKKLID